VLVALRKGIRRREIWVQGANIWRNPEDDLPPDFEENRDVHYEALSKPRDPQAFIADLQKRHIEAFNKLNNKALKKDTTGGVKITRKKGEPWISVPPVGKQPEPTNLTALKEEVGQAVGCFPCRRPGQHFVFVGINHRQQQFAAGQGLLGLGFGTKPGIGGRHSPRTSGRRGAGIGSPRRSRRRDGGR
jgi:hypothetical protein